MCKYALILSIKDIKGIFLMEPYSSIYFMRRVLKTGIELLLCFFTGAEIIIKKLVFNLP